MMRLVLATAAVVLTAGCASPLTVGNSQQTSVQSTASSEATYRALLPVLKECFPTQFAIESNYFPDAREGEVTIAATGDGSFRIEYAKLKVTPAPSGSTVAMTYKANFPKLAPVLPQWVAGKDGGCPYGSRVEAPYPSQNPYRTAPR